MKAIVYLYNKSKYGIDAKVQHRLLYSDVKKIEEVTGNEATQIGDLTDSYSRDPFNEYFIVTFVTGEIATFRSTYADFEVKKTGIC